jgi:tetratricopeptide (TPR) repeat protein
VRDNRDVYPALLAEWNNIRAGMQIAHRLQANEMLLDYVDMLRPIWFARGLYTDARQAYKWATLAVADDVTAAAIELAYGQACIEQSDYDQARQQLERSLTRFEALDDRQGSADAHYHLARVATEQDQLTAADAHLQAAWRDYQQVEHLPGLANVLYRQGRIAYLRGDYRETDALTIDSLKIQRQLEDMRGEMRTLLLLSMSAMEQKDLPKAQTYSKIAYELSKVLQDIGTQTDCCYALCNLYRLQHKFDQARTMGRESLVNSHEIGNRATEANVLLLLALVEKDAHVNAANGDLVVALQYAQESVALYEEIAFQLGRAAGLITLGLVQRELGDFAAARSTWENGLHLAETLSNQVLISRYSELLAALPGS